MHVEGPCDVPNRLAFREQMRCNLRLISIELTWTAEADATLFCCFPTSSGPLADQIPLELSIMRCTA